MGIHGTSFGKESLLNSPLTKDKNKVSNWLLNPNSKETNDEFNKYVTPIVSSAIKAYAGGNSSLTNSAKIMAWEALKTYNPSHDVTPKTHITNSLKKLSRENMSRVNAVKSPERNFYERRSINKFITEYEDEYGDEPSSSTISDTLGLSVKKI